MVVCISPVLKIGQDSFLLCIDFNYTLLQVLDMLIRDGSLWPLRMLRTHKSLRTLLFMFLSGIIVDSMYLNSDSMFWLFKPLKKYRKPTSGRYTNGVNGVHGVNGMNVVNGVNGVHGVKTSTGSHVCHHKDSCNSHTLQVRIYQIRIHLCSIRFFEFCQAYFA